ncbi:hypothetical protein F4818DRAFT_445193 [Hypoxylon cercidicola]|nr:hypothetical protein F4818DRAFT_445193 [Hypoxylon cercidicola]
MEPPNNWKHIALEPTTTDQFPLAQERITKSQFKELYNFTTFKTEQIVPPRTYEDELSAADQYSLTAASDAPLATQDPSPLDSSSSETHTSEDIKEDSSPKQISNAHVLVLPGHPPSFERLPIDKRNFTLPKPSASNDMDTPSLPFEDLCRAAIEQGMLGTISSASIVTDTETLWALFSTLHDKVAGLNHASRVKGIVLVVQAVDQITFIKAINSRVGDNLNLKVATAYLKNHGLQWCLKEDGGSKMDAFKRVVSYEFGDIKMVVEDGNQTLSTAHKCDGLDEENVLASEQWE